jgi:riboflavin synthase
MFTGIIQETGKIERIFSKRDSRQLSFSCSKVLEDLKRGDSVAVDGVCLTAEEIRDTGFTASATLETLKRSTLQYAQPGRMVNLERPVRPSDRLGGHIVQGHVDTVGQIVNDKRIGNTLYRTVRVDRALEKYIVEKGSIAMDGISLTVAEIAGSDFTVVLIPETLRITTFDKKNTGDFVNVEVDILAKYMEKLTTAKQGGLTEQKLREFGF